MELPRSIELQEHAAKKRQELKRRWSAATFWREVQPTLHQKAYVGRSESKKRRSLRLGGVAKEAPLAAAVADTPPTTTVDNSDTQDSTELRATELPPEPPDRARQLIGRTRRVNGDHLVRKYIDLHERCGHCSTGVMNAECGKAAS
jgi:hypothetical protein